MPSRVSQWACYDQHAFCQIGEAPHPHYLQQQSLHLRSNTEADRRTHSCGSIHCRERLAHRASLHFRQTGKVLSENFHVCHMYMLETKWGFFFAKQASARVGKLLAERAQQQGVPAVHWERKYGQKFHGKVKELLVSMQEAGLPLS